MKLSLLFVLPAITLARGQTSNSPSTLPQLQERLTAHITDPKFAAASWGVKIVSLDSGKILFENNPQKLFSPASNSKLYTIALALDRLGANGRIKTSLYAKANPRKD